ncbi:hypothetical protein [Bosea sp. 124]|uniref:hypothetical protein n=1 Tax=Bosea sp. 124 TaxID=2135642 RepID=UPI000D3BCBCE|nr:hypothetical protein [Bosea sp. 124]PTM39527.1 hypothetical protein C8D03_1028 [Bosea sp. 124]
MVQRAENLGDRNRAFHQQACDVITSADGAALDTLTILQDLEGLYRECLSSKYDAQYDCQHRPLFTEDAVRELIDGLISAQLGVLRGDVGTRTVHTIVASAESVMGKHPKAQRERSRISARRDIARTALCHAVITAMDATLNAVISTRLSKARVSRLKSSNRHARA